MNMNGCMILIVSVVFIDPWFLISLFVPHSLLFVLVEDKIVKTMDNIVEVKAKVKVEITSLKDKLKLARETIGRFKAELSKVQEENQVN